MTNPHNEIPKDTVEEIAREIEEREGIILGDDLLPYIEQALTTAYNKGVEVGKVEERQSIIGELRLRDMPSEDGGFPLYTANQMARFLTREKGNVEAITPPLPESL